MEMNKALFLDRDGVVNIEKNYIYKIEDFEFIDGIFELVRYFKDKGFKIIVITNQAGIARGFYSEDDYNQLNNWMLSEFKKRDSAIDEVYFCPFHLEKGIGEYKKDSYDRKPNPGMIFKARDEFNLNLTNSWLIGDKESDIQAGINAGVGKNIFLGITSGGDSVSLSPDILRFESLDSIYDYIRETV
jgi:D-glycero-D-manno-heptose 1,7-bisphosphate phosphatase